MIKAILSYVSRGLVRYLERPVLGYHAFSITHPDALKQTMQPGDVLLVDGNLRISRIIKFLTQSSWSHAALFIGDGAHLTDENGQHCELIEADAAKGVVAVSVKKYSGFNTRICRPKNLTRADRKKLIDSLIARLGHQYDLKNVIDLMRYLIPYPPVPAYLRRHMIALGSGEPSRAICSTLIAEAFQAIHYPILPDITPDNEREIRHIRHHSLFTPRDFDLSPYFEIVKPTLNRDFDYKKMHHSDGGDMDMKRDKKWHK